MALSIKSDEADRLARELAAETGETLTEAVVVALRERLDREHARRGVSMRMLLARLAADVAALPVATGISVLRPPAGSGDQSSASA